MHDKDRLHYQRLRKDGVSNREAARLANAAGSRTAGRYVDWTLDDLKHRARDLGMHGYAGLSKKQLIERLRDS